MQVFVQLWGPIDSVGCGYEWITIGEMDVDSLDLDMLKEKTMTLIRKNEYKPFLNAARLKIIKEEEKMNIMLLDLW